MFFYFQRWIRSRDTSEFGYGTINDIQDFEIKIPLLFSLYYSPPRRMKRWSGKITSEEREKVSRI
jgi:hypothetical protein